VSRSRRKLRTRLVIAMAVIAIGVLLITAVATVALARRGAVSTAEDQLEQKAPDVAGQLENLGRRLRVRQARGAGGGAIRQLVATALRISNGGIVTITPDGRVADGLAGLGNGNLTRPATADLIQVPRGLTVDDLDTAALLEGRDQTGRRGGIVFVARPLTPTRSGTPVLLLTQTIEDDPTSQARGFFLLAAIVSVGLAILVAVYLARRLARPLAAMGETARSIAAGDLAARVDLTGLPDDELGDLARTLNEMAEQLEHARGRERAFVLSISHDLRTPLTSIKGYSEALVDGAIETDAERARAARVIEAEARRLERLVADLLDLARLDARQFSLSARSVDAAETVRTAVDAFAPAAADLGITLEVDGPESLPAEADPERLAQIVANLVENALKFATSSIVVDLRVTEGDLDVRVRDDGPGILPADLPHVFERLYVSRTAPGRSLGTGIGLAIVRELAGAMGGQAWADVAADGVGATFVVRLPGLVRAAPAPTGS
jgi:two-component system sensor histidine kinase BaeS